MIMQNRSVDAGLVTSLVNMQFGGFCPPLFAGVTNLGQEPFSFRQLTTDSIGSVNCEQRHANATTRTTPAMGWSSRPRPVNRTQATSSPKSCESRRRVMRGGKSAYSLAPKNRTARPLHLCTGKAFAFTKEQIIRMSYYRDVYLKSDDWKSLRLLRLIKSNYTCALCAATSECLDVHHLDYKNLHDVDATDLRAVCRTCHNKVHKLMLKYPKLKKLPNNVQWRTVKEHLCPFIRGGSEWLKRRAAQKEQKIILRFSKFRNILCALGLASRCRLKWTVRIFELGIEIRNPVKFLNEYSEKIYDARCRPTRNCQKLLTWNK